MPTLTRWRLGILTFNYFSTQRFYLMHAILIYLMNYKFYHLGHGSQNKGVNEEGRKIWPPRLVSPPRHEHDGMVAVAEITKSWIWELETGEVNERRRATALWMIWDYLLCMEVGKRWTVLVSFPRWKKDQTQRYVALNVCIYYIITTRPCPHSRVRAGSPQLIIG